MLDEFYRSGHDRQSVAILVDTGLAYEPSVRHAEFGVGQVKDKSGSGDELKVVVVFENGSWKKLLVKYAPLEKIG